MTREINRRLHLALGKCWHIWVENKGHQACNEPIMCDKCWAYPKEVDDNPDYCADPRLVIKEMMGREDWKRFAGDIGRWELFEDKSPYELCIRLDLILDKTGKLTKLALEWLESKHSLGHSDGEGYNTRMEDR